MVHLGFQLKYIISAHSFPVISLTVLRTFSIIRQIFDESASMITAGLCFHGDFVYVIYRVFSLQHSEHL